MANEKHIRILKQGVDVWNKWLKDNFTIIPDLREADLSGADLTQANLRGANLYKADLSHAKLIQANLSGAELRNANLSMANLHGANLYKADLSGAYLFPVDLSGASLREADLSGAYLFPVDLSGASLREADLRVAYLNQVDLREADLSGADLTQTIIYQVDLREADLSSARINLTVFGNVDLSVVKGLDTIQHDGPSTIGIDTISKSKGNIPEVFLRGAGVPDNFVIFMRSLTTSAFDFYSCFISYSSKDQAFVERLYADLQAKGVRCWYAPHDIQGGKKIHEQVDQAIRLHDKLLLVLSESSMDSEWVKTEIYHARQREVEEKRRKLFPISLVEYEQVRQWRAFDADIGKDMAREVREYYIPDFTHWKDHDAYQQAFERLLRDLKA